MSRSLYQSARSFLISAMAALVVTTLVGEVQPAAAQSPAGLHSSPRAAADSRPTHVRTLVKPRAFPTPPPPGIIQTIAGSGHNTFSASVPVSGTSALLADNFNDGTGALAVDSHGDLYVVLAECTIFEIAAVDHTQFAIAMQHGDIYQIGGGYRTGIPPPDPYCAFWDPYSGDGAPALTSAIGIPFQLAVDPAGNVFYSDPLANRIREISNETATQFNIPMVTGDVYTVAGSGPIEPPASTYCNATPTLGDAGPATAAILKMSGCLLTPNVQTAGDALTVDAAGDLLIADAGNCRLREVAASTHRQFGIDMALGDIYTVGGNDCTTLNKLGVLATSSGLSNSYFSNPGGMPSFVFDNSGNVLLLDCGGGGPGHGTIQKIDPSDVISSVVTFAIADISSECLDRNFAPVNNILSVSASGQFYIATGLHIYEVDPVTAAVTLVAGNPGATTCTSSGDGGPAIDAQICPGAIVLDSDQNIFEVDRLQLREIGGPGQATASAGAPQTVPAASGVQLDGTGSTPGSGGAPLAFQWTQDSGPAVSLSDAHSPKPSLIVPAVGNYGFSLTVTNATGQTATATTTVMATDVAPTSLHAAGSSASLGGPSLLQASFSIPVPTDTFSATITWGDASGLQSVAVFQSGQTGSLFATHRYVATGNFTVAITVRSSGGASVQSSASESVQTASASSFAALWASSTTRSPAIDLSGNSNQVTGIIHSNNDIVVSGSSNSATGATQYVSSVANNGSKNNFAPSPVKVSPSPPPVSYNLADFAPGGLEALAAGGSYFDETRQCASGSWNPKPGGLAPGVYWVPCNVTVSGTKTSQALTIVSTGEIQFAGSNDSYTTYAAGLLAMTSYSGSPAIHVSGSSDSFTGALYDLSGQVLLDGSKNSVTSGLFADTLTIAGSSNVFTGSTGVAEGAQAALSTVVPNVTSSLSANMQDSAPGSLVTYTATITNTSTTAIVDGAFGAQNVGSTTATANSYLVALQYFSASAGTWNTLGSFIAIQGGPTLTSGAVSLVVRPDAAGGVTYPSSGDPVLGSAVSPGVTAAWGYEARVSLSPAELLVLDAPDTTAMRSIAQVGFASGSTTLPLSGTQANFAGALQAANASVVSVTASFATVAGITDVTPGSDPALASIAPGATVQATAQATVAIPASKGVAETSTNYQSRLALLDNSALSGQGVIRATTGLGAIAEVTSPSSSRLHVPILTESLACPSPIHVENTLSCRVTITNTSSASAQGLSITGAIGSIGSAVTGLPTTLGPGDSLVAMASALIPGATPSGQLIDVATLAWQDTNGSPYGPVVATATVDVVNPVFIQSDSPSIGPPSGGTLVKIIGFGFTGATQVEFGSIPATSFSVDSDNQISAVSPPQSPGAVSLTVVTPQGQATAGFFLYVPMASITSLDPSSGPMSGGTTVTITGTSFSGATAVDFGSLAAKSFTVVSSTEITAVTPPEPTSGALDVTITTPIGTSLLEPADRFTFVSPVAVTSVAPSSGPITGGTQVTISGIDFTGATQVAFGTVATKDFIVVSDTSIQVVSPPGTLGQVHVVVVTPRATSSPTPADLFTYTSPPVPSVASVSPTGGLGSGNTLVTITGAGFTAATAVDFGIKSAQSFAVESSTTIEAITPAGSGTVDVTVTTPGGTSPTSKGDQFTYSNTPPPAPPTITILGPLNGTRLVSPTPVTASVTAPTGESLTSWSLAVTPNGSTISKTIAKGTGAPPATLASLDTTLLDNGIYELTVSASAIFGDGSTGTATGSTSEQIDIDGALKLGHYVETFRDLTVPVGDLSLSVERSYDSYDKSVGDFGVGWHLSLSNFRVTTSGPLGSTVNGSGDWTETPYNCNFLSICSESFSSGDPHFVSVTWPDGHQEIFDFTPQGGSNLDPTSATAAYKARSGTDTTSTLTPVGSGGLFFIGNADGILYPSGGTQPYAPANFILTAKNGYKYLLSSTQGLLQETDPAGNTISVTPNGITSSMGPSVSFARDSSNRITQVSDPNGKTLSYAYSAAGDLASSTDANGTTTTYTYDSNHDLVKTVGPGGPLRTLNYDSSGRLASITDANGITTAISTNVGAQQQILSDPASNRTIIESFDTLGDLLSSESISGSTTQNTSYTYDALGHLLSRTDPNGHSWSGTYDSVGNLTSETDPTGARTAITYGIDAQPTSITDPTGKVTSYAYDSFGDLLSTTDPNGHTTTNTYNSQGEKTSSTDALGKTTADTYTASGNLASVTDPNGHTTSYSYDADGHLMTTTNPLGAVTTNAYDAKGNLVSATDPDGNKTTYSYDALGRLVSTTDPLGRTTTDTYDGSGSLLSSTIAGSTTSYTYDADGRLLTTTNPLGATTTNVYDAFGNLVSATDPDGHKTTYAYNAAGQRTSMTDAAGHTTTYSYDGAGHLTGTTNSDNATTTQSYDPAGRLTQITDALGGSVKFTYDGAGNLLTTTDPDGHVTTNSYDAANRLITSSNPATGTSSYAYDPAGNKVAQTNANGQTITNTYDPANQLLSETGPGVSYSFTYDAAGRRLTATDSTGTTTFRYDTAGDLTSAATPQGSLGIGYDSAGRRASLTLPTGGTVTYGYNTASELTALRDPGGGNFSFTYDPAGNQTGIAFPNGVNQANTYTALNQVASIVDTTGSTTDASFAYTYGAAGNRTSESGPHGNWTYSYDSLGRLTGATGPTGNFVLSYDPAGNIQTMGTPSGTQNFTYNSAGQITSDGTNSYSYDASGNQITAGSSSYGYNALGQMTSSTVSRTQTSYAYNADGLRVTSTAGSSTTPTVWDSQGGLPEPVLNGSTTFVYAGLTPLEQINGATTNELLTDAQGSVRNVTNSAGAVVGSTTFNPFGTVASTTGTTSVLGYTGAITDPTGLVYDQARYYNPEVGQFTRADSYIPNGKGTQGWNRYSYTADNPVTYIDRGGHEFASLAAASGSLGIIAIGLEEALPSEEGAVQEAEAVAGEATAATAEETVLTCTESGGCGGAQNFASITTSEGEAVQGAEQEAIAARSTVEGGANLYRVGTMGQSAATEGQFWSLTNPFNGLTDVRTFAAQNGIPPENVANLNFVETAVLNPGAQFVTRLAPGVGTNPGGAVEVVVEQGGVTLKGFSTIAP